MKICIVSGCKNSSRNLASRIENSSFHQFPSNEIRRNEWVASLKMNKSVFNWKNSFVCSNHFDKNDFYIDCNTFLELGSGPFRARLRENGLY